MFKKFIPKSIVQARSLKLNVNHIYLPKETRKNIPEVKRVDVYYDVEQKAIRLVFSETGLLYVKPTHQINGQFSKVMPKGVYMYKEKEDVYILDS